MLSRCIFSNLMKWKENNPKILFNAITRTVSAPTQHALLTSDDDRQQTYQLLFLWRKW